MSKFDTLSINLMLSKLFFIRFGCKARIFNKSRNTNGNIETNIERHSNVEDNKLLCDLKIIFLA
jgi:hypothetical protein